MTDVVAHLAALAAALVALAGMVLDASWWGWPMAAAGACEVVAWAAVLGSRYRDIATPHPPTGGVSAGRERVKGV